MAKSEYVIFCDESTQKGKNLSNFYGGAILKFSDLEAINKKLDEIKNSLNLNEIKRQNVSLQYLDKYKVFLNTFLDYVEQGKIKIRIVFSETQDLTQTQENKKYRYSKFYYIFIKHAFGLSKLPKTKTNLRLYFDQLPVNIGDNQEFKKHIWNLQYTKPLKDKIRISKDNIVDIDSKKHPIIQGVDLITGIMDFYANDFDNSKPLGNRGTAKIELYKLIIDRINKINPNYFLNVDYFEYLDNKVAWKSKYLHCQFKLKK